MTAWPAFDATPDSLLVAGSQEDRWNLCERHPEPLPRFWPAPDVTKV